MSKKEKKSVKTKSQKKDAKMDEEISLLIKSLKKSQEEKTKLDSKGKKE